MGVEWKGEGGKDSEKRGTQTRKSRAFLATTALCSATANHAGASVKVKEGPCLRVHTTARTRFDLPEVHASKLLRESGSAAMADSRVYKTRFHLRGDALPDRPRSPPPTLPHIDAPVNELEQRQTEGLATSDWCDDVAKLRHGLCLLAEFFSWRGFDVVCKFLVLAGV
ncbi:hypothetical protein E2542_SST27082 [Spatholobus suberectus]|nr:hypothetical protein E2542_SST27082 [Spatholobus suberectus]